MQHHVVFNFCRELLGGMFPHVVGTYPPYYMMPDAGVQ